VHLFKKNVIINVVLKTELLEDLQFSLMLLTNVQSLVLYCSTDLLKKQKKT